MAPVEYAETYGTAQRLWRVAAGIVLGAVAVGASQWWLFPSIAAFADVAPCRTVLGINGADVLWYGLFVGGPLAIAVAVGATYGRMGLRILKDDRFPPARTKVFRPVRIVRGNPARRVGYLHLFACVPFLAISIWGVAQAAVLSHTRSTSIRCAAAEHPAHHELRTASADGATVGRP